MASCLIISTKWSQDMLLTCGCCRFFDTKVEKAGFFCHLENCDEIQRASLDKWRLIEPVKLMKGFGVQINFVIVTG